MARRAFMLVFVAVVGCAPGDVLSLPDEADASVRDSSRDTPASFVDAASDRASIDALAAPDAAPDAAPADVSMSADLAPSVDAAVAPDLPTPADVATCSLPPAAARPPAPGPDGAQIARDVANEHPDWVLNSCASMGGDSRYLHEVLRRLRARDARWGLDRLGGPITGDVVDYFYGDGCPEGRREVYKFDVILRHCGVPGRDAPPGPTWIDRSSEGGVWTLMGYDGTTPDAGVPDASTMVALPDGSGVVRAVAAERADLLRSSCVTSGGNNEFLFEVVRRLRRMDTRWGLNWKRGVVGDMSQDVVDYYYGPAGRPMEGSTDTYIVDIIGGHCGTTPSAAWTDVTEATRMGGTIGRWTLAGRTDLGP